MKGIMSGADRFCEEYYPALYRYLCGLTGDPVLAGDIAQDVFLKALMNYGGFREKSSVMTWLCSIGKNRYYDILRRAERKNVSIDDLPHITDGGSICAQTENREAAEHVSFLLNGFDETERELFLLRACAGLPYSEIASHFGRTETWARTVYFRVKNRLAAKMKEDGYEL